MESDNLEKMKTGTEELKQIIYKISEKVYGSAGQGAAGPGAAGFDPSTMGGASATGPTAGPSSPEDEENVVDVDFEDLE